MRFERRWPSVGVFRSNEGKDQIVVAAGPIHGTKVEIFDVESEKWTLGKTFCIIGGHGGCVGCAHPPKNLKSPDTPPCRRQGGCAPHGVGPGAKKIFFRILSTKILNFF